MSVEIESVTIGTLEKRLVLSNAGWAATLKIGTDWTRLRIGMRVTFDDFGASVSTSPRLWVGVLSNPSSGLANGPLGNSTSHFFGWRPQVTWQRIAGPPLRYTLGGSDRYRAVTRVGSSETVSSFAGANNCISADTSIRHGMFFDITKGTSKWTIEFLGAGANGVVDLSYSQLVGAMALSTLGFVRAYLADVGAGSYTGNGNTGSTAVNEGTNGPLNSICVAWNHAAPKAYISEILFAKMA